MTDYTICDYSKPTRPHHLKKRYTTRQEAIQAAEDRTGKTYTQHLVYEHWKGEYTSETAVIHTTQPRSRHANIRALQDRMQSFIDQGYDGMTAARMARENANA